MSLICISAFSRHQVSVVHKFKDTNIGLIEKSPYHSTTSSIDIGVRNL
jgi:hypothetical protein